MSGITAVAEVPRTPGKFAKSQAKPLRNCAQADAYTRRLLRQMSAGQGMSTRQNTCLALRPELFFAISRWLSVGHTF
ncbi:hypothetical protein BN2476_490065 [Paraburkholderia piptadeniae]|uniref:Uncharacterized protein n=1 Tax=Paraburkholderia piptadeniae TaxID=1701573 RepID=A0A1N7SEY2_9BURK|nr:hypothetical protein BN2476_490065 [Paraburkholderia piptadeniae]